jgi:Tfp pilus assembly protein PilN
MSVHLTPGPAAAAMAARRASRRIFAIACLVALAMAAFAALIVRDTMAVAARNRVLETRVEAARAEMTAADRDAAWVETRDRALGLASLLEAGSPAASVTLATLEKTLPADVMLRSLRFSRKDGTIAIDGRSPRYEGGEALRAALGAAGSGWRFTLEGNGYDQGARVYAFRITGVRSAR